MKVSVSILKEKDNIKDAINEAYQVTKFIFFNIIY